MELWGKSNEETFFTSALANYSQPEQLFYQTDQGDYYAYWPKTYAGKKTTLQSRNSLIGSFTEKYVGDFFQPLCDQQGLFTINGAVCEEVALTKRSPGDVVIATTNRKILNAEELVLILEVKMSLVWNWQFVPSTNSLLCLGDYFTHQGNPSLLRSDSMLKAIGKSINIRVSGRESTTIPIVIIGNSPIQPSYFVKVDHLKTSGIVQGFWSLNPDPISDPEKNIKKTSKGGFLRMDSLAEVQTHFQEMLSQKLNFFSSMKNYSELGKIIEIANSKFTYVEKGQEFIRLINR